MYESFCIHTELHYYIVTYVWIKFKRLTIMLCMTPNHRFKCFIEFRKCTPGWKILRVFFFTITIFRENKYVWPKFIMRVDSSQVEFVISSHKQQNWLYRNLQNRYVSFFVFVTFGKRKFRILIKLNKTFKLSVLFNNEIINIMIKSRQIQFILGYSIVDLSVCVGN